MRQEKGETAREGKRRGWKNRRDHPLHQVQCKSVRSLRSGKLFVASETPGYLT